MYSHYFSIMEGGLKAQLEHLSLSEVVLHLDNHLASFHLDEAVCSVYLNRLLAEADGLDETGWERLDRLLRRYLELAPFNRPALDLARRRFLEPRWGTRLELLQAQDREPEIWRALVALDAGNPAKKTGLAELLARNPDHVEAAQLLLSLESSRGEAPGEWLRSFRCPRALAAAWDGFLFLHQAALARDEQALALWPLLDRQALGPHTLNLAAEVFLRIGDQRAACSLYRRSLRLDAGQDPARRRLAELEQPFPVRPELVARKKVSICLYSWNKADMLLRTLESLAASDIGPAKVSVLLNGCTDHSSKVAAIAGKLFPDNDYQVIELPVNVGAPAARNWLIEREVTWASDYTAFLDDDVDVPRDWLARFLTVMEERPGCGVVGAKVLDPGSPARIQYLFRYVGIAKPGFFKVSLNAPIDQFDVGQYDFVRPTRSVMGCLHLFRTQALRDAPLFDIRFSPSQVDDIEHDLQLLLKGWEAWYCGTVACVHHQSAGLRQGRVETPASLGSTIGNDLKLCFKYQERMGELAAFDALSLA